MKRSRAFVSVACLVVLGAAFGQVLPNAPVVNFRLPMFNPEGYKTWELRGSEGRYVSENLIELVSINLKIFSGDETGLLKTEISSPKAVIEVDKRIIRGPENLRVVGNGYEMFGEDWVYDDSKKTIEVRRNVVVTFDSSVGNLLK